MASGFVCFEHIPTTDNPADILTKPLPWHKARVHVEPLLFWKGEMVVDSVDPMVSSGPITKLSDVGRSYTPYIFQQEMHWE